MGVAARVVVSRLPQLARAVEAASLAARRAVAEHVAEAVRPEIPVRTGALLASTDVVEENGQVLLVSGGPAAPHGKFVHDGTVKRAPRPYLLTGIEHARANLPGVAASAAADELRSGL